MGDYPSTPPPQDPSAGAPPARLEYGADGTERKSSVGSKLVLVIVWGLGVVSWAVWIAIIVWVFLRFLI